MQERISEMLNHADTFIFLLGDLATLEALITFATNLDGTFAPAWIGYGNAFAAQEEVDQAMLGYRTAACLFPGCHLPTLYIGMEYMRNHSFKLAEQFFMQAKTICPSDPLVYNELGVVAYHMKDTLAHIPSSLSEMWEPTVVNLAHAYRKLKIYHEAISCYERALTLLNRNLHPCIQKTARVYDNEFVSSGSLVQDNFSAAITYYHKALWLKPDDQFCTEMLSLALVDEGRHGIDPKIEFE
ncbi:Anaphase-promoting complex subunit 6 [Citrus sinensis]|uniref:Anaphase-promoting complex subunit 6 n=1 Tax=Citrus sinensis TaxID=2711 RepID=A0ACB8M0R0_CITSI|nr:Anaphase-promoting complex subunit 6 [Citrus sinensis]